MGGPPLFNIELRNRRGCWENITQVRNLTRDPWTKAQYTALSQKAFSDKLMQS